MRYEHRLLLVAFAMMLAFSCKKDTDDTPPVVTIVTPGNGSTLTVPNALTVTAQVEDDHTVEHVSFFLANGDGIPVGEVITVNPSSNPSTLTVQIPTNEQILSGAYRIVVRASDGTSDGHDSRTVDIIGTPDRLRAVFGIGAPAGGQAAIYRLDSAGQNVLVNTVFTDLAGSTVSSKDQRLFVCGSVTGPLVAFTSDGSNVAWEKPNLGNGQTYFTSIDACDDGRLYVGTADGAIRAYNAGSGNVEMVAATLSGFRSDHMMTMDDRVIVIEHEQGTQQARMSAFQRLSGSFITAQLLDLSTVGLFARDDDHVLVFGTRDGTGVVQDRSIDGGGGWEPHTWPAPINTVERIDVNSFMVGLSDGSLERFTYSNAGSVTISNGQPFNDLRFDRVNGVLYGATATGIQRLDPQTGTILDEWPTSQPMRYAWPLFNR